MARGETEHVPYAEMLLEQGARIDIRDELLKSTALGWACRWGRVHFCEASVGAGRGPGRDGCRAVGDAQGLGTKDETR
jgi:hypothetical protein